MKAEGVRELAGMLFFQSTLTDSDSLCVRFTSCQEHDDHEYIPDKVAWGEKKMNFSGNWKESAAKSRQTVLLILSSGWKGVLLLVCILEVQ